jgi:hypothetical protein
MKPSRILLMVAAMVAATTLSQPLSAAAQQQTAALPTIDPYSSDSTWSCLDSNPSCARDPWWAEWDEQQDAANVTYSAIGPHFTTERRYAEAIDLLWQWPEGKSLLRQADGSGVLLMTLSYDQQTAFATYSPQRKLIAINSRVAAAPTWMLADVIGHELSHASDDAHGVNQDHTSASCLAGETAATLLQQRFLVWLTRTLEPQGLPTVGVVSAHLSDDNAALANSMYTIGFSTNIPGLITRAYDQVC